MLTLVVCVTQNYHWADAVLPLVNHMSAYSTFVLQEPTDQAGR